jgi:hypothetical protein
MVAMFLDIPLSGQGAAQVVIENPSKPAARNADRILELKEVMRIKEDGGEFFFKSPSMQVGPDSFVFVRDEEQLLKFDPKGKFVRNFFRKGQGPGEFLRLAGFFILNPGLMIQGTNPRKLTRFSDDGVILKEAPFSSPLGAPAPVGKSGDAFVFTVAENALALFKGATSGVVTVSTHVFVWTEQRAALEKKASFPGDVFVIKLPGGGASFWITPLIVGSPWKGMLALSHEQKYLVKILEIETGKIIRSFRRSYDSIKYNPPKTGFVVNGIDYGRPPKKFVSDIEDIFPVGEVLWIVTSTRDKDDNPLIDVFDSQGSYQDRFYIRRPPGAGTSFMRSRGSTVIQDGFLYQIERQDDFVSIAKYEIKDPG